MTAPEVPSHGFEQADVAEPSHAAASACSSPQEDMMLKGKLGTPSGTLIRVRLGVGADTAHAARVLAARLKATT